MNKMNEPYEAQEFLKHIFNNLNFIFLDFFFLDIITTKQYLLT